MNSKTIVLFISIWFTVFSVQAQTGTITINKQNKRLVHILKTIESKTDFTFSFSNSMIDVEQKLSLKARNKPTEDVLQSLFEDIGIKHEFFGKQIVLTKQNKQNPAPEISKPAEEKYTLSGYITDSLSGEVLIGAYIYDKKNNVGAASNAYGFYSLTLPAGSYSFNISSLAHKKETRTVNLTSDKTISPALKPEIRPIDIIVVSDKDKLQSVKAGRIQFVTLDTREVNQIIGAGGDSDVLKSLSATAGVNTAGDGAGYFFVRGGNKDQNYIITDDAPVYHNAHLFGFVSAIQPEAINDIKLYKSDFPLKYGGRLSSVVDIKMKEGNMNRIGFSGIVSPLMGSYTVDGPIKKETASFFVGLRNSHINWLLKNTDAKVSFQDFHLKLNTKLNSKNRLYFTFYAGNDSVSSDGNQAVMTWSNVASSFRWNKLYSDRLFSNTTLYFGKYDYFLHFSPTNYWNSYIGNLSLKTDFTYYPSPKVTWFFGADAGLRTFNPGNLNNAYFYRGISMGNVFYSKWYAETDLDINSKMVLHLGLRLVRNSNTGPARIFEFNNFGMVTDTTDFGSGIFYSARGLEPHVKFSLELGEKLFAKLSYNRQLQYLSLLSNTVTQLTTPDIWLPAGPNLKPQKLNQLSAGLSKTYGLYFFAAELYYKHFTDLTDYADHANLFLNPLIAAELRNGKARGYGIELTAEKTRGKFRAEFAYSYSKIRKKTPGINNNAWYPAYYDRPHTADVSLSADLNRWNIQFNWTYSSGLRFSSPVGFYYYDNMQLPIYGSKNNDKLPDYHRMDLVASFRLNKKTTKSYNHHLLFSVFNLYGRQNYLSVNFNKTGGENGEYYVPSDFISESELLPTALTGMGFIPSVSYRFVYR